MGRGSRAVQAAMYVLEFSAALFAFVGLAAFVILVCQNGGATGEQIGHLVSILTSALSFWLSAHAVRLVYEDD